MNQEQWLRRATGGDSNRKISERAGISDATLGRHMKSNELPADTIIKIAEAYDSNPIDALVALGFMKPKWTAAPTPLSALKAADDQDLTDEILYRLKICEEIRGETKAALENNTPVNQM